MQRTAPAGLLGKIERLLTGQPKGRRRLANLHESNITHTSLFNMFWGPFLWFCIAKRFSFFDGIVVDCGDSTGI